MINGYESLIYFLERLEIATLHSFSVVEICYILYGWIDGKEIELAQNKFISVN
jgi:hypothetical protein